MTSEYFNNLERVLRENYNNYFIDNIETYSYTPPAISLNKIVKKFRLKLAICIINSLDKDYKFYIKHVGINSCESVLICN